MKMSRIILLFVVVASMWGCQKPKQAIIFPEALDVISYKNLKPYDNRIYVPVILNGKDYNFLFDTGASTNVVDKSISLPKENYLGQQVIGSVFDPVFSEYYSLDMMFIGKTQLLPDIAYVLNLGLSHGDTSYKGILGVSSLKSQIIYIKPQSNRLYILNSIPEKVMDGAYQLDLIPDNSGRPTIKLYLMPGFQETFILDTGAQTSSLELKRFEQLVSETGARTVNTYFTGVSGSYKTKATWLSSLSFAGVEHEDLMLSKSAVSLLGMDVLSKYDFIIDFKSHKLYLMNR